jgi:hypothetical protein
MEIDRRLNLVQPVLREDGTTLYVHSTPIRREVYEAHFLVISRMVSEMYDQGIATFMMPRLGLLMLRNVAEKTNQRSMIESHLLPEMWRLTNVLCPKDGGGGWDMLPFTKVMADKIISDEEVSAVQNAIVFFTSASWVHTAEERKNMIYALFTDLGSRIGSWSPMDFTTSLPTSTASEPSGAAPVSSIAA